MIEYRLKNRTQSGVRKAITFKETGDKKFDAEVEEFVLVGIHILHKTNNFRQFFIATWEHNSIESAGYQYVVIPDEKGEGRENY